MAANRAYTRRGNTIISALHQFSTQELQRKLKVYEKPAHVWQAREAALRVLCIKHVLAYRMLGIPAPPIEISMIDIYPLLRLPDGRYSQTTKQTSS